MARMHQKYCTNSLLQGRCNCAMKPIAQKTPQQLESYYFPGINVVSCTFFSGKLPIYSSIVKVVQGIQEIIKITSISVNHLTTTTSTEASRWRRAVIAPPLLESGKPCCSRQSGIHRAKAPQDQRTRTATIADEEKRRSKASNMQTHERRRTKPDPIGSTEDNHRPNLARSVEDTPPHALQ